MEFQIFMTKTYVGVNIKKSKKFFKKMIIFIITMVILVGLFFAGKGFANLLTNKNLNLFNSGGIRLKSLNYYAIHFGEFDSEEDAMKCAIWTASSGGAAYVYNQNKYLVIGQIYSNIDDAESVVNGFNKDITYQPSIVKFKTKNLAIDINKVSNTDKNKINNDINLIFKTITNILKISNNLDKSMISTSTASSEINSIKSDIKIAKLELQSINSNYNNNNINKLVSFFVKMEEILDVSITKLLVDENYGPICKNCACEIFFNYYDFSFKF